METFEEYERQARKLPISLRNDRSRVDLPVTGLQEEAGRLGALLTTAFGSGRLVLTPEHRQEAQDRLADVLWYTTVLCEETGLELRRVAAHSLDRLKKRLDHLDPDRR